MTLTVGAIDDSATEGTDYASVGDSTVTILDRRDGRGLGYSNSGRTNDSFGEGDEKITVSGSSTGPPAVVNGMEMTIVDDDTPSTEIMLSVSPDNLSEGSNAHEADGDGDTEQRPAELADERNGYGRQIQ